MEWMPIISNSIQAAIGPEAIVYCLAAIGLNVHFGYTGLLNFGQAGFMCIAGYGLAATVVTFGMSFWLGLLVGLGGTIVLALLLGVPTLRLRADQDRVPRLACVAREVPAARNQEVAGGVPEALLRDQPVQAQRRAQFAEGRLRGLALAARRLARAFRRQRGHLARQSGRGAGAGVKAGNELGIVLPDYAPS